MRGLFFTVIVVCTVAAFTAQPGRAAESAGGAGDAGGVRFSLLGRYSLGRMLYEGDNRDTNFFGKASSLVDVLGAELFAKQGESLRAGPFRFEGSLSFEVHRQLVDVRAHYMPRLNLRLGGGTASANGKFRWGPVLRFSTGQYLLLEILHFSQVETEEVSRRAIGLGMGARYRIPFNVAVPTDLIEMAVRGVEFKRKRFLDFTLTPGADLASSVNSTITPSPIESALNPWVEFSMALSSITRKFVEIRFRWTREHYRWAPAAGGSELSVYRNEVFFLDFAMGVLWF